MTVYDYFDWPKRVLKEAGVIQICFSMCLKRRTAHMPTKKTCARTYNNTPCHEFSDQFV